MFKSGTLVLHEAGSFAGYERHALTKAAGQKSGVLATLPLFNFNGHFLLDMTFACLVLAQDQISGNHECALAYFDFVQLYTHIYQQESASCQPQLSEEHNDKP